VKIPPFLESAYQSDHKIASFVSTALSKIVGHIASNQMVFFPEYTDHSVTHLELTLQTALDVATAPARGLLTSSDAATLATAVALHDCGMYLSRDGFESLIDPHSRWAGIPYFDKKDWRTLWEEFYAEATRFDGRKLRLLFGNNYRPVKPLPPSGAPWADFDYLLVGEFLRRHHPRLAHEIAIYGLPAKNGNAITICPKDSDDHHFLSDISGLVARSHGMDLRPCLSYLEDQYQNRINPRRSHAIFLGVLLRIADYFQIQATRAPTERTDVTSFKSQLSEREWKIHQSITDIHNTSSDPEAIVVNAKPQEIDTFLRLKRWLRGLQSELDRSWAILGEVYGLQSHNNLNLLGLKIRRVKSNLDDDISFAKTVSYVPEKITFDTANADLLKLLVGPLYDNDPGIGLRELFQNAIDAVREFEDARIRHPALASIERYTQDADVVLDVQCDEKGLPVEIVITDRGIGMTTETIRDYFLKAGASFRRSNAWRQEYEDSEGHSRVLRTGRFGVGVLAAFLLGDAIEVTTRHALAGTDEGIAFAAQLDDDAISLNRALCPVGTRIRIKVPENSRERVGAIVPKGDQISFTASAGYYFLKSPSLKRRFSNKGDLSPAHWLPQINDENLSDWRSFRTSQFERVFWTFNSTYPALSSNGISIIPPDSHGGRRHYMLDQGLPRYLNKPNISLFDKDGYLPVNLQRTGLQGPLPFGNELLRSIVEDLLAHALVEAPTNSESAWFDGAYEGFENYNFWPYWLIGHKGFIFNEPLLLRRFSPRELVVVSGGAVDCKPWGERLRSALPTNALMTRNSANFFFDPGFNTKGLFRSILSGIHCPAGARPSGHTTFVPSVLIEKIKALRPGRQISTAIAKLDASEMRNGWKSLRSRFSADSGLVDTITSIPVDERNPVIFSILKLEKWDEPKSPWSSPGSGEPLTERWMELINTPMIPFEAEERVEIEKYAATKLGKLLELRRQVVLEKSRKKPATESRTSKPGQPD
jgi:molecular chaperone HtpG